MGPESTPETKKVPTKVYVDPFIKRMAKKNGFEISQECQNRLVDSLRFRATSGKLVGSKSEKKKLYEIFEAY